MTYSKRIPPVQLLISKDDFNRLVGLLKDYSEKENCDEKIKNYSIKLKEKLLRYSVPRINEEQDKIDIRFFINEIVELSYILIFNIEIIEETNFYEILLKNRESIIKACIKNANAVEENVN